MLRRRIQRRLLEALGVLLLCAACTPAAGPARTATAATAATQRVLATATPEGPTAAAVNPLTGQPVADSGLLKIPAVLISISHFPATARPQAGLSFAPFVYEFYITEGATRFLAVFYGEFPAVEVPVQGGCETRTGVFTRTSTILGNRVWLDSNSNGIQDAGERGISGVCVNLYDQFGNLVQRTSTDSNGMYGFNVDPGSYTVEFVKPAGLAITQPHAGDDSINSDAEPTTGRANVVVSSDNLAIDAGLVATAPNPTTQPAVSTPPAQVGPIRSGRLIYAHIASYFKSSCLVFGSASPEVLVQLPQCLTVFHQIQGGGFMLDISQMESVARANQREKGSGFDYSGNVYSAQPPGGGVPADQLRVFFAYQNQSGWYYDPLYQAYLRYVDTSEYDQAGLLHADTDRLTGRQLHFENVIVLFAQHEVVEPTNLDIHLDRSRAGRALLFRDGQVFNITWSTKPQQDKSTTGVRPIRFLGPDERPEPLKPGHTWIIVVTPQTTVEQQVAGQWLLTFAQPEGAK